MQPESAVPIEVSISTLCCWAWFVWGCIIVWYGGGGEGCVGVYLLM